MVPLVASPIYGFMYKNTIESFSGAFLLFTASLYLVVAVLLYLSHRGLVGIERQISGENANVHQ